MLIEIVKKYVHILENKCTNAENIKKKQDAWQEVARSYNSVATSGLRTWLQLRHAYENIKQRTKKNIATENKQQYCQLKLKAAEDKKQIMRTGGGAYRSPLSEMDNQILAMVAPQIKPLQNKYDDAAVYFGDTSNDDFAAVYCDEDVVYINGNPNMVDLNNLQTTELNKNVVEIENNVAIEPSCSKPKDVVEIENNVAIEPSCSKPRDVTIEESSKGNKERMKRKCKKMDQKTSTKEQYFKMKLENARLEHKYFLQRERKEKLEIHLLKLKIKRFTQRK